MVLQVRDHPTSFVVVGDGGNNPITEINTDITIPQNEENYLQDFALDLDRFSGCRVDYRLKSEEGGVRIGSMYIGVNTREEISLTDHYTETDDFDIDWTCQVVLNAIRLSYRNGSDEKYINITVKYFPV